jgi:3-deoxy-D-manno-octulosonate cytidylyltransferase
MSKVTCVIPARLASSRFPRKILAPLHGKPLIQWVWEAATQVSLFDSVIIALDAEETAAAARSFGATYYMTPPECPNGTMRLCNLIQHYDIAGDIFVCWQGDEPFLHEAMIRELLQSVGQDEADIWTLKKPINDLSLAASPHTCKVVTDHNGYALYFSRSQIPYHRDTIPTSYDKHIGIYAYSREALMKISRLPMSSLCEKEQLEMLNFMYYGLKIRLHETLHEGFGIDTREHLQEAHVRLTT